MALVQAGIDQLRLYFMVGLPTETLEDIREIARLSKYLQHRVTKDSQGARKFRQITLSVASFVPKPWTPFQWVPFADVKELKLRQKLIRQELSGVKEVRVHTDLPKWAYTQALIARGDRRVGDMLLLAQELGWQEALRQSPVNPDFLRLPGAGAGRALSLGFPGPRPQEILSPGGIPAGPGRKGIAALPARDLPALRRVRGRNIRLWGRRLRASGPLAPPPDPHPESHRGNTGFQPVLNAVTMLVMTSGGR